MSLVWTSDGTAIGTGGSFTATLSDGQHTITASATDAADNTGSATITITVGTVDQPTLVGSATPGSRGTWTATVTNNGSTSVTGTWDDGTSCTIPSAGACSLTVAKQVASVTFTPDGADHGVSWI